MEMQLLILNLKSEMKMVYLLDEIECLETKDFPASLPPPRLNKT